MSKKLKILPNWAGLAGLEKQSVRLIIINTPLL